MNNNLFLYVRTPDEVLYNGDVASVTSYNTKGSFDVLPQHANFISIIDKSLVIHELGGETKEIKVHDGIMRIQNNRVDVYLGFKE